MNKIILKLGYSCNNNCLFCHAQDKKAHRDLSFKEIIDKISLIKSLGYEFVILSGGEPAIRRDFLKIVKYVRDSDMKLGVVTNGRILSYKRFCEKVFEYGLAYAYVSLHGNKEVHNILTQAKSFEQTVRGIKNISKSKNTELIVNCVVNKYNLNLLKKIVGICYDFGSNVIKFSNINIEGAAIKNLKEIVPRLNESVPMVKEAVNYALSRGMDARIDGFPICLMYGLRKRVDDLKTNNITYMSESFEKDLHKTDYGNSIRTNVCRECKIEECPGIDKNYAEIFGCGELMPAMSISNSFNYFKIAESRDRSCPSRIFKNVDNDRDIFLSTGNRVLHMRTETLDFSPTDIDKVKKLEQIYLNVSWNKQSKDFSSDYVKLNASLCKGCGKKHVFKISGKNMFLRDDKIIEHEIIHLKGSVLDVGCGNIRYAETLSRIVRKNKVEYLGLDIERKTIVDIKKKYPRLKILPVQFEDFEEDKKFDNILFLRSINHFKVPAYALEKACGMLKIGSSIILCDNIAFGVAHLVGRERLHSKESNCEHYHLLEPSDVIEMVKYLPLKVIGRRDITRNSANQWFLKFQKTGD